MEVSADDFDEEVLNSDKPVFVLFWASWCTACKRSEVTVREIEEERDDVKVVEINVDKNPALREKYDILGVPTFMIFHEGELKERRVAAQAKKQLNKLIDSFTG